MEVAGKQTQIQKARETVEEMFYRETVEGSGCASR